MSTHPMFLFEIMRIVPKNLLSSVFGWIMRRQLPRPLAVRLIGLYCRFYSVNVAEAEHEIAFYPSLASFFTRGLKKGSRKIEEGVVSPVDGYLVNWGSIDEGRILQIKGQTYSLQEFLKDETLAASFYGGVFFTIYLSPRDYHWVHAPVAGVVSQMIHVPGKLWPVNSWSLNSIPNLFVVNERVHSILETANGMVAVTMVGATNVGSINLVYDHLETNSGLSKKLCWFGRERPIEKRHYCASTTEVDDRKGASIMRALELEKGEALGYFALGSTVILLFQKGKIFVKPGLQQGQIILGQEIANYGT